MSYRLVRVINDIKKYIEGKKVIAFDFECCPLEQYKGDKNAALDFHKLQIVGISLSVSKSSGIYIPLRHSNGNNVEDIDAVMNLLRVLVFENEEVIKIAHNIAYEAGCLYGEDIILKAPVYDTSCAAQLILKNEKEFRSLKDCGLKNLVKEVFHESIPTFLEVTNNKDFNELNPEDIVTIQYACRDSDYTLRLYHVFNKWFNNFIPHHKYICEEIESPVAVFTGIMKYNGINVNENLIEEKRLHAENEINKIKEYINSFAGRRLNIGSNCSTNDIKKFLYDELNLPILKKTDTNKPSLDDDALQLLKHHCEKYNPKIIPLIDNIQKYRKITKLKSTYIDGLSKYINDVTRKIHTNLYPLGTDTGRFSSSAPNLQNLPRKTNDSIGIRDFFVPSPGYVFVDFDFSQIELRVGAYYCKDKNMIETYKNNGDIHGMTTSVIFNVPYEESIDKDCENYKERRTIAKNCNFGVFFGLYPKGLQNTLKFKAGIDKTENQCSEIIDSIKKGYPNIVKWQLEARKKGSMRGYSETALGRRRMLKYINSIDWNVSSYWERCAMNSPIQGTAADIIKLSMVRILSQLHERTYIRPLLQVHDELLFEVREDKVNEAIDFIKATMEEKPFDKFNIPIVVEGAIGESFGQLKEIE